MYMLKTINQLVRLNLSIHTIHYCYYPYARFEVEHRRLSNNESHVGNAASLTAAVAHMQKDP